MGVGWTPLRRPTHWRSAHILWRHVATPHQSAGGVRNNGPPEKAGAGDRHSTRHLHQGSTRPLHAADGLSSTWRRSACCSTDWLPAVLSRPMRRAVLNTWLRKARHRPWAPTRRAHALRREVTPIRTHFRTRKMHRLNSGHFAVEDCLPFIVEKMMAFCEKTRTM
jgi:hypothetical protein